jgi:NitT/TauT family transport system ATP-binding protein
MRSEYKVSEPKGSINITDLGMVFKSRDVTNVALQTTNLSISPGEFVCILGPSGCGKSTLLNVIAGFLKASEGQALLDGELIQEPGPERSMVFQHHSLLPWKTVGENIEMGPRLTGDLEVEQTVSYFLDMVGLSAYRDHYPEQLSGGMQQRVGIARALATNPRVLLMDEPFGALDYQTRLVMQENLLSLWDEFKSTVVFITHDVDEAIFLSDRILVMSSAPGCIIRDIKNPLKRPRDQLISSDPIFIKLKRECLELIRAQSMTKLNIKADHQRPEIKP